MFIEYNPNPTGRRVGDCAVRAVAKALGIDWEQAFALLSSNAYAMGDMPSSDSVWGSVLRQNGFYRSTIPDTCSDCYTAEDFCKDNPRGVYVLGFGGHVATVVNGNIYDSWNSSKEMYFVVTNGRLFVGQQIDGITKFFHGFVRVNLLPYGL